MRFLIISMNYLPESTSIGPYTADLAEYLLVRGHDVQIITGFPQAPQWKVWATYDGKRFMREIINGVPVLRTYLYVPKNPNKPLYRILFDMSFTVSSLLGGITSGGYDLVVAISPPLQLGLTAWLLSRLKRVPFFIHIQDLVPDAAVAVGILSSQSRSVRIAHAMERFIYQKAAGIGVICDGFARNLRSKGVSGDKIAILPNYIDTERFSPSDRVNDFRQRHNIRPEDFVAMYSGSISGKQGLHTFVEAAAELRGKDRAVFYIVGEGAYLPELQAEAESLSVSNLHFLSLQPRDGLSQQLSAADALIITQRKSVTDVVFPGKLLYYMACARPVIAAVSSDSETGRFISEHKVGIVVPPEDPKSLAQAITFLMANPIEAQRIGQNGRIIAKERFDGPIVLRAIADHLEMLAGSKQ